VLELLPPGFTEILAMELGDYGATGNHKVEIDPTNPEKVIVSSDRRIDALERMNWEGFSSEQL
jgi:hypothetical protein